MGNNQNSNSELCIQNEAWSVFKKKKNIFICEVVCLTWNVVPLVLDVHLVQASLCGLVLDCDGAILVISDMWSGSLA